MQSQVDLEFQEMRVDEAKEEKKVYQENLVWKVKVECQEQRDWKGSQAHL